MRRIFAIWAVCLCWGILNAAPLGPFNATLLEQLKNDYQKGEKEVTRYIELQEKVAEKYIKMTPLSVTAKKKLPPLVGTIIRFSLHHNLQFTVTVQVT